MNIEKQLEELDPIVVALTNLGFENIYIDFETDQRKFSINIKGEKPKK